MTSLSRDAVLSIDTLDMYDIKALLVIDIGISAPASPPPSILPADRPSYDAAGRPGHSSCYQSLTDGRCQLSHQDVQGTSD